MGASWKQIGKLWFVFISYAGELACERQSVNAVGDPQCNQKASLSPGGGLLTNHRHPEEAWSVPDIIAALDVSASASLHG